MINFRRIGSGCFICTIVALCVLYHIDPSQPAQAQVPDTQNDVGVLQNNSSTGATNNRPVESGSINLEFSRVYIHVKKAGVVGHEHAVAGKLASGSIPLNGKAKNGAIVFDMRSFDADSEDARKYIGIKSEMDAATRKKVNENMRGAEVLDVNRYPQAQFVVSNITPKGTTSGRNLPEYVLTGEFTLHGKTNKIEVVADLEQANGWNHLRGGFRILQSQYGIKPYSKMMGAVGVADELLIFGDFWIAP